MSHAHAQRGRTGQGGRGGSAPAAVPELPLIRVRARSEPCARTRVMRAVGVLLHLYDAGADAAHDREASRRDGKAAGPGPRPTRPPHPRTVRNQAEGRAASDFRRPLRPRAH